MSIAIESLQDQLKHLRLSETAQELPTFLREAESTDISYKEFLYKILSYEQKRREEKQVERRIKWAQFPFHKTLEDFKLDEQQSLSKKQLNQLSQLTWLEQQYNLILLGPPGVGKTLLATGLGMTAIQKGFKVAFVTMGELVHLLKTREMIRKSQVRMNRIIDSDLVIIDDLMFMAMDKREANLFFHLINQLYDRSSIILTSNKGPEEWGDLLGDPAITTAILDRIIHKAEVIHLNGDSYRMRHRSTIFEGETVQK
ncbi:IS21-like element helper ATPase IstB [Bacillus kwashiorkori]|uniref:IS21-like element helper ATPase IstB n=1 Tax=Bacillus kwashiorkori TaxID=1522318 RepID=UPI00078485DA|nr:IS21-like element helper ATPase IstB [Bacillus kwashiorkori]